MKLTRRALLASATALSCGRAFVPEEAGPLSPSFPLAVATGDVTCNGAFFWTRFAGTGKMSLLLSEAGGPWQQVSVMADGQGFVHQWLGGLLPFTVYRYAFVEQSAQGAEVARSEEGRFRTAPSPGALVPLRFGATSCARQTYSLSPLSVAAEQELDAFFHLGDAVYADGSRDLADYRAVWAVAVGRRPNRVLRASTSLVATWDDHESTNNVAGDSVDPALFAAARTAFFEFQPVRPNLAAPGRIWRKLSWGSTADVFVLDCRSERNHERREYLSRAQLDWLKQGLKASTAVFKVVLNSVPISEYAGPIFDLQKDDRWEGFPEQRTELLEFVDATPVEGVLFLTGDFHLGAAGRVSRRGPGSRLLEFATGPAGQAANPSPSYPGPPQFDFGTTVNNVTRFDLDPLARTARVLFFSGEGRVLFDRTYPV